MSRPRLAESARLSDLDSLFNKAVSVHTVLFWAEWEAHLREIFRVLSPGGRLVLGYHPLEDARFAKEFPQSVYSIRSIAEIEALLITYGFQGMRTQTKDGTDGLMAWSTAEKAS